MMQYLLDSEMLRREDYPVIKVMEIARFNEYYFSGIKNNFSLNGNFGSCHSLFVCQFFSPHAQSRAPLTLQLVKMGVRIICLFPRLYFDNFYPFSSEFPYYSRVQPN